MNINKFFLINKKNIILIFFIYLKLITNTNLINTSDKNLIIEEAINLIENKNVRCILNIIASCEGTKKTTSSLPQLSEYQIAFMNTEKIENLKTHPKKIFRNTLRGKTVVGSASGRYQFIQKTWEMLEKNYKPEQIIYQYKDKIKSIFQKYILYNNQNEKMYDEDILEFYNNSFSKLLTQHFSPFWQDLYAIILMLEKNIRPEFIMMEQKPEKFIQKKQYQEIMKKLSLIWSSIPYNFENKSLYESFINRSQKYNYVTKKIGECIKKNSLNKGEKI